MPVTGVIMRYAVCGSTSGTLNDVGEPLQETFPLFRDRHQELDVLEERLDARLPVFGKGHRAQPPPHVECRTLPFGRLADLRCAGDPRQHLDSHAVF